MLADQSIGVDGMLLTFNRNVMSNGQSLDYYAVQNQSVLELMDGRCMADMDIELFVRLPADERDVAGSMQLFVRKPDSEVLPYTLQRDCSVRQLKALMKERGVELDGDDEREL